MIIYARYGFGSIMLFRYIPKDDNIKNSNYYPTYLKLYVVHAII